MDQYAIRAKRASLQDVLDRVEAGSIVGTTPEDKSYLIGMVDGLALALELDSED